MSNQQILDAKDISDIRQKVSSYMPLTQLASFSRDKAVIQMLKCSEFYKDTCFLDILAESKYVPEGMMLLHQSLDALHFGMRWIFDQCSTNNGTSTAMPLGKAMQLVFDTAEKYSGVDQLLDLTAGSWGQATYDTGGRICISIKDKNACEIEHSNGNLTRNSAIRTLNSDQFKEPDPEALGVAVRKAMGNRRKGYTIPSAEFERLRKNHDVEKSAMWRCDPSWDLGGYNFAELRKFWIVLYTIAMMHSVICQTQKHLQEWILIKRRSWWIAEISKRSNLSNGVVSMIVNDLTYDPRFYQRGSAQATMGSQPLFPIGEDSLALSNMLVLITDVERNVWELMSRKKNKIFSEGESIKETYWATSVLVPWLERLGLKALPHFPIKENGNDTGDLDLLILDTAKKFGLGVQLKWIKGHDRLSDVTQLNKQLRLGIEQARHSLTWLRTCPEEVNRRAGLGKDELKSYQLEGLVLSRISLGGTEVQELDPEIPVINEFLMQLILDEPHHKDLRTLWQVAKSKSYRLKLGVHFKLTDWTEEYAGITFVSKEMNPQTIRDWDPEKDMGF